MNVWRLSWKVSQHQARTFWLGWVLFILFFTIPVGIGWALSRAFDALSNGDSGLVYRWAVAVIVLETARMASIHWGALVWTRVWVHMQTFLRANLLAAQVASGGPEAGQPVGSAGEAVTHFRDDAEDVAKFVDGLVDVSAGLVFTVLAAIVLCLHPLQGIPAKTEGDRPGRHHRTDPILLLPATCPRSPGFPSNPGSMSLSTCKTPSIRSILSITSRTISSRRLGSSPFHEDAHLVLRSPAGPP